MSGREGWCGGVWCKRERDPVCVCMCVCTRACCHLATDARSRHIPLHMLVPLHIPTHTPQLHNLFHSMIYGDVVVCCVPGDGEAKSHLFHDALENFLPPTFQEHICEKMATRLPRGDSSSRLDGDS